MDCWISYQENFIPSAGFLFKEDNESVEDTCNLEFHFFQAPKIDIWNKMSTAIEIISIEILMKELEEIKVWIGIKLLIEINQTKKIIVL